MALGKKLFFVALFLSLLMESQTTYKDPWSGGFAWYFHADLKSWLPQTGVILNPLEITVILILLAWALRGRRDRRYHFERGLLFWPMVGLLAALAFGLLWGATRGGYDFNIALWEVRSLAYFAIAYFLVGILFTHRRDLDTLTWVMLIAIFLMGIECIVRYYVFLHGAVGDLDYDHEDATLLSFALLLSISMVLLGSTRRQKLFALASLPVDMLALMLTHRRAGIAALAVGLVFLAVILYRVDKKIFLKVAPVTALLVAIYLGAYWNCSSGTLCQPARAISSVFNPDPRDLASNQYRDLEKLDLTLNIQANPFTGVGFGQPFVFYAQLPNLSFWRFWHYTPHNEILWVWVDTGIVGFLVFWWLIGSGLYRGGRIIQSLSIAGDKNARALLAAGVTLITMQVIASYVDLGLTSDRAMLLLGVMFGVIGHLPGILRRSTGTDEPARPGMGQALAPLDAETPEAQVEVLAQVLVAPVQAGNGRRTTSHPHMPSRWGQKEHATTSRWGQSDQTTPTSRWSKSNSATNGSQHSRPVSTGQRTVTRPRNGMSKSSQWMSELPQWAEDE